MCDEENWKKSPSSEDEDQAEARAEGVSMQTDLLGG